MSKADKNTRGYYELTQELDRLMRLAEWDDVLHSFQSLLEERQYSDREKKLLADLREYRKARARDITPGGSYFEASAKEGGK